MKKKVLSDDAVSTFCLEAAEALKSGFTVSESFLLLSEQGEGALQTACMDVYKRIYSRERLADAVSRQGIFPEHMVRVLEVSEGTIDMERVFRELSVHFGRQAELKKSVGWALVYPLVLFAIVLAAYSVFIVEVLPVYNSVMVQAGAEMTPAAGLFIKAGMWISGVWLPVLIAALALAAALLVCFAVPALRLRSGAFASRLFAMSGTGKKVLLSQVASVLSLGVAGTGNMREALEMSLKFARGTAYEKTLDNCAEAVRSGKSFSEYAERTGLFKPVYCRMIGIGERTRSVNIMMSEVARRVRDDMESSLQRAVGRVEPAAVIILSAGAGWLLLSIMLPLMELLSAL